MQQPDEPRPQAEPAPSEIRQEILGRYRALSAQARELNWTVESLRKIILAQHALGLPVEPGPLDLDVAETEQRRITNDELVRLLGLEVVEEVRTQIKPTVSKSLKVVDRPVKPAAKSRRRNVA
ncbi:MAG: hypothetical protein BGO49_11255 [Planctomycetales bacterium 71-10]|nr:MAG: hypothetical protein BGO49_11255 [Planctomycetales bacterium 71-10]